MEWTTLILEWEEDCSILSIVLAVCALVFGIGFLPSLVVCLIWIVNQTVYCNEALKYSKAGNKIS